MRGALGLPAPPHAPCQLSSHPCPHTPSVNPSQSALAFAAAMLGPPCVVTFPPQHSALFPTCSPFPPPHYHVCHQPQQQQQQQQHKCLRTDRAATSGSLMVWSEVALAFLHAPGSSLDVSSAAHTCPARPPPFRLARPTHSPATSSLFLTRLTRTHAPHMYMSAVLPSSACTCRSQLCSGLWHDACAHKCTGKQQRKGKAVSARESESISQCKQQQSA